MPAIMERSDDWLFASESVSEGHPDKVCDQISDAILDACLRRDPQARVACEAMVTANRVVLGGEYRMQSANGADLSRQEFEAIARETVRDIGYEDDGFHWRKLEVANQLTQQSPEISEGVDRDGAGDQGIMFGYATDETPSLMPAPLHCAHGVLRALSTAWRNGNGTAPGLGPDAKSQVTLRYRGRKPVAVENLVVSVQHRPDQATEDVRALVSPVVRAFFQNLELPLPNAPESEWFLVNPSGSFTKGGPAVDAGLTGRKIIVDTYGGAAPHGGGAFSGKDPTKVDRSAAYAARYLAKNIVAAGLAPACLIQVSYAIGSPDPCSFYLHLIGNAQCDEARLERALPEIFPLNPRHIRDALRLNRPIYRVTATYGHFGRKPRKVEGDETFPWERTDLAETLRDQFAN